MSARILVVEDNADLAQGIAYNLKLEGYEVQVAADGRAAGTGRGVAASRRPGSRACPE